MGNEIWRSKEREIVSRYADRLAGIPADLPRSEPSPESASTRPAASVTSIEPSPGRTRRLPSTLLAWMLPSPLFNSTVPASTSALIDPSPVRATTLTLRGAVTTRLTDGDCQDPM